MTVILQQLWFQIKIQSLHTDKPFNGHTLAGQSVQSTRETLTKNQMIKNADLFLHSFTTGL